MSETIDWGAALEYSLPFDTEGEWCPACRLPSAAIATHTWHNPATMALLCRRRYTWCRQCHTLVHRGPPMFGNP